jgi:hypothetical protein
MAQTMYAHMNKRGEKKKKKDVAWAGKVAHVRGCLASMRP